jgi:hypothetical protein
MDIYVVKRNEELVVAYLDERMALSYSNTQQCFADRKVVAEFKQGPAVQLLRENIWKALDEGDFEAARTLRQEQILLLEDVQRKPQDFAWKPVVYSVETVQLEEHESATL